MIGSRGIRINHSSMLLKCNSEMLYMNTTPNDTPVELLNVMRWTSCLNFRVRCVVRCVVWWFDVWYLGTGFRKPGYITTENPGSTSILIIHILIGLLLHLCCSILWHLVLSSVLKMLFWLHSCFHYCLVKSQKHAAKYNANAIYSIGGMCTYNIP